MTTFQKCYTLVYLIYVIAGLYYILFTKEENHITFEELDKNLLIKNALKWCHHNIQPVVKRKYLPLYKIELSNNGTILGSYEYQQKLITIYPNKHESTESLIDSCIHEYVHHLQIRSKRDDTRYRSLTNKKSYLENDYEIEARRIALKYRRKCMKDLGLI